MVGQIPDGPGPTYRLLKAEFRRRSHRTSSGEKSHVPVDLRLFEGTPAALGKASLVVYFVWGGHKTIAGVFQPAVPRSRVSINGFPDCFWRQSGENNVAARPVSCHMLWRSRILRTCDRKQDDRNPQPGCVPKYHRGDLTLVILSLTASCCKETCNVST